MVARTRLPSPPVNTVAVVFTRNAAEIDRALANPGADAARKAILLICGRPDGLVAGDCLRVDLAGDIADGVAIPRRR